MDSKAEPMPTASKYYLFAQVSYRIMISKDIDYKMAEQISSKLNALGASEHSSPSKNSPVQLKGLTHIIALSADFEAYEYASQLLINVVTPAWVESSVRKGRLSNPRSYSPDSRLFYSGLVICIADVPEGDKDAIIGGVLAMGGLYSGAISKMVTHVVALSMDHRVCQIAKSKDLSCKIVLPHWFDDCLKLGKRIDESPYLLPDPALLRSKLAEGTVSPAQARIQTNIPYEALSATCLREVRSPQREKFHIFRDKRIRLGEDLNITTRLQDSLENVIMQGGGQIVNSVEDADVYICRYRENEGYGKAARADITIGNLSWLYFVIAYNVWTLPTNRLLHYPIARFGLPGFRDFRLSLSNYNGEARAYLENLAIAAGCQFTKTMKQDNTHLITAHTMSEKCDAAREWNVCVINHLWLEESYAKWEIQDTSNPRYNHFPPNTNLSEIVGRTPINKNCLQSFLENLSDDKKLSDIDLNCRQADITRSSTGTELNCKSEKDVRMVDLRALPSETGTETLRAARVVSNPTKTPDNGFSVDANKERNTPTPPRIRHAKENATTRLQNLVSDIALYEKEMKRVGGVVFGGRRSKEDVAVERKRSGSPIDDIELDDKDTPRAGKKRKQSKATLKMRVLVTGYPRWSEDPKVYIKDRDRLRSLGILLTQDYKNCTFLVAPRILRTRKFCCAIAQAPTILHTSYLEDCLQTNKLLDTLPYLLDDEAGEETYGLELREVLERARSNRGHLFQGQTVWVTDGIHGGFETYKAIVEMNGGKCALYKGRSNPTSRPNIEDTIDDNDKENDYEDDASRVKHAYLISGSNRSESKLWPKFRQMAEFYNVIPRIVRTDWVLDIALSQRIQWKDSYELNDNDS